MITDDYPESRLNGSAIKYVPFVKLSPAELSFAYPTNVEPRIVYIADSKNHCIRKLTVEKAEISTYAGVCGTPGFLDGLYGSNKLYLPTLVGVDAEGYLFIFDSGNNYIRMVDPETQYMHTLIQGACKEDKNTVPSLKVPFQLKLRAMICYRTWIKTSGEPSEHIVSNV